VSGLEIISYVDVWSAVLGGVIGALVGFLIKVIYDWYKEPKLEIVDVIGPFQIRIGVDTVCMAYRVRVRNREKRLLNKSAENCIGWLALENAVEDYRVCWVGTRECITLNVGDQQDLDVCALEQNGNIVAPTESGYPSEPRVIGRVPDTIRGKLRVTASNGRKAQKNIEIRSTRDGLNIILS